MAKLSEEKLEREYITDENRVYEVIVVRPPNLSVQDIGTLKYTTISFADLNAGRWRKLDRALIAAAA